MKFCNNCSAPLDDDAVYCPECGQTMADDYYNQEQSSGNNIKHDEPGYTVPQGSSDSSYNYNNSNNYSNNNYNAPKGSNPGIPWLIVSIVSFFCCASLLAIPGFVLSLLSMTSFNEGNVELAQSRAKTAMILTLVSIGVAILITFIIIVAMFSAGFEYY